MKTFKTETELFSIKERQTAQFKQMALYAQHINGSYLIWSYHTIVAAINEDEPNTLYLTDRKHSTTTSCQLTKLKKIFLKVNNIVINGKMIKKLNRYYCGDYYY